MSGDTPGNFRRMIGGGWHPGGGGVLELLTDLVCDVYERLPPASLEYERG